MMMMRYSDLQEAFGGFMLALIIDLHKMLYVLLYETFRTRQNMNEMNAARESACIIIT